jgi:hypothetical protein
MKDRAQTILLTPPALKSDDDVVGEPSDIRRYPEVHSRPASSSEKNEETI